MKLEVSYDKAILTHEEIQQALKELVLKKLGRTVRGDVSVDTRSAKIVTRSNPEGPDSVCCPVLITNGHCWLEPATKY